MQFTIYSLLLFIPAFTQEMYMLAEIISNPRISNGKWIYQEIDVLKEREPKMNALKGPLEESIGVEIAVTILATMGENNPNGFINAYSKHGRSYI